MGIKIKKPKIKVSAPKAVTKAISSVTKPLETAAKGALQSTGGIASSALKGDLKGAAAAAMSGAQSLKDAGKQLASGQLSLGADVLGAVGGLTGSRDISSLAGNIEREGQKGIEQYGDTAMDIGANVATGGTYGAAQAATQSLASGGLKGLLSGKGLQDAALQAAGSYAGVDPNMLQAGLSAAQGDLKGAALSQLGSYGGFDPKQLQMGMSALTGDKAGIASGLASQFGAGDTASGLIGQFAGGKGAREVISDQAGAYADDAANRAIDAQLSRAGVSREKLKDIETKVDKVKNAPAKLKAIAKNKIASIDPEYKKWEAAQAGYIGKDKKAAMQRLLQDKNNMSSDDFTIAQAQISEGKIPDKYKMQPSNSTAIKEPGMLDKFKGFVAGNKTGLGLGAGALAAGAGYVAGESARDEAKKLMSQQLGDVQAAGREFQGMKYDPARYKQEREFIQQRIAGGGITPQEKKMQQEGDIRAARAAAAQRLSGMEQQARMGAGATGAGASLAASLAGGQAAMSEQSSANLAREASASQRLEQDIQRQTNLARQQTAEEADLSQQQGQFGLSRAGQAAGARTALGNLALARGEALTKLATEGRDLAVQAIEGVQQPAQPSQPQQQPQQQPSVPKAKVGGARRLAQRTSTPPPKQTPKPAIQQFNQQNAPQPGQGQGFGVLAPVGQAVQQAQNTFDQAKQKAEEFKKNPLGAFGIKF